MSTSLRLSPRTPGRGFSHALTSSFTYIAIDSNSLTSLIVNESSIVADAIASIHRICCLPNECLDESPLFCELIPSTPQFAESSAELDYRIDWWEEKVSNGK